MKRVLIVEDEPEIADLIRFHVEREGLAARSVASGKLALDAVRHDAPDVVVLDLMLPDLDGLEVCRRLKQNPDTRGIPILMVSAKGEETDIVSGIELGADDYVTKPFSAKILIARLKNILRRGEAGDSEVTPAGRVTLRGGSLVIDAERHRVLCEGRPIELTVTEFGVLHHLASKPGFVRTRDQIIAAVHGKSTVLTSRTVDVHVTALRRKLGELSECIETVRGVGYRFAEAQTVEG
ncbi:MAG: response regulator transcription factor [Phycisphaerales bacterium]|jgi:DNA-binding response OmpR family regulator